MCLPRNQEYIYEENLGMFAWSYKDMLDIDPY